MRPFDYYRVTTVGQAVALLAKHQDKAAILAGGSDLLGMMKDGIEGPELKTPKHLIDIKGIKDLAYIKEEKGGLKIGAGTTLHDIIHSDLIESKYPIVAQAAKQVAVPQIRNVATLGGNLCQRPRCWYFRGKLFSDCIRKGGTSCYGKDGENQYHAILGSDICAMAYLSDMAPALIALDAKAEIAGPKGMRTVPLEKFYVTPETNLMKENVLTPQEMLVAIEIPAAAQARKGVYLKLKERQAFDFAVVSVAVSVAMKGSTVVDSRVVFGGLAPFPNRSSNAEIALKGKELKSAVTAACSACVAGAQPLSKNAYKVEAAKGVLEEALNLLA
jgi:xanthine dehydrogenase YagS FAD-binding subunit